MAKIEKREVAPTPSVEYVLTLNQQELDVLETLRYFHLGGTSSLRDALDDTIRAHGRVHLEWATGRAVWPND